MAEIDEITNKNFKYLNKRNEQMVEIAKRTVQIVIIY